MTTVIRQCEFCGRVYMPENPGDYNDVFITIPITSRMREAGIKKTANKYTGSYKDVYICPECVKKKVEKPIIDAARLQLKPGDDPKVLF